MMVLTLTAGAIFVMWLGEQITERGIGNGMSLLITFSILERLWPGTLQLIQFIKGGVVSPIGALIFLIVVVAVVAAVVAMTIAARRIPIQIPRKVMGRGRIREGQKTFIPIRLITAGVMPIIFANTIIMVPGTIASFTKNPVMQDVADVLRPGAIAYDLVFAFMVVLFSYFYTSIIFNSVDLAENLKKQGGFIPGVKPGASTADYIDAVLARITLPGGLFLAAVSLIPIFVSKGGRRAGQLRRYLGAHRGGRAARHDRPGGAAPHAPEVRRLHEDGTRQVPRTAAAVHVALTGCWAAAHQVLRPRTQGDRVRPPPSASSLSRPAGARDPRHSTECRWTFC